MDPATIMLASAAIGTGIQAFGGYNSYQAAKEQAAQNRVVGEANKQIAQYELQIEAQKMKAMELDARRRSLESIRAGQRARAMGLVAATAQGAGGGSGLQGGYGTAAGNMGTSLLAIGQSLDIGRSIFGFNALISNQRQVIADAQAKGATAQSQATFGSGLSSLGGSVIQTGQAAGRVFGSSPSPSYSYNENNKYY